MRTCRKAQGTLCPPSACRRSFSGGTSLGEGGRYKAQERSKGQGIKNKAQGALPDSRQLVYSRKLAFIPVRPRTCGGGRVIRFNSC